MFALLGNNPILFLLLRGWQYAGKHRKNIIFYAVLLAGATVVSLCEPYVIGRALNAVQTDNVTSTGGGAKLWHDVSTSLYLYFLIQLVFWLFHGPARVIERYCAFHIKAAYKEHLFSVVTSLPVQWHRQHHSGESIDKINRAAIGLGTFFEDSFEIVYMCLRLLGSLVVLFWFMPFAGWVGLATTIVAFLNIALWDRKLYSQYHQLNKFDNRTASAVHDYVTNIGSVITLRLENRVIGEVVRRMFAPLSLFRRNTVLNELKWAVTTMLIATMITVVLLIYAHNIISSGQAVLGGTFFTLFEYLRRIGDTFYNFAMIYGTVVREAADVKSADTILDAMPASRAAEPAKLPAAWRSMSVCHLRFRYEDEKHRVHHLDDVSIQLAPGRSIAFVGESGSGKSTLLSLLRGLHEPQSVGVRCDGLDLPEKLAHLTANTTLIPQDPEIFADTIRFNITFGLESDDSSLMTAIRLACFETVLARLPNGLETNIAEKGVNLSGGEKQRLALARGIFFAKDSDILLLDEPTSSVDTINEVAIYTNLLREYRSKCIISSVHKLHLLPLFDMIYLFSDGVLVEEGTFEELLALNGTLAAMWSKYQASRGSEETVLTITANLTASQTS
ncbi:MAG TPA: ABC transporter ATP-binding protein [Candidatus Obscuribacterales bacterium]